MDNLPFHLKYRPEELEHVIGQDPVVKSLQGLLSGDSRPKAYLFSGQAGLGKTTFARIMAKKMGCLSQNLIEVDAAQNTGIDAARELSDSLQFQGFGNPIKAVILDEVHALSSQAFKSLLKILEEPPAHVFWFLCTTDPQKIPATITQRTHAYYLKPVSADVMFDYLCQIAETEPSVEITEEVLNVIVSECEGSVRQALVYLSMVRTCSTADEALALMKNSVSSREGIDFCRFIVAGQGVTWQRCMWYVNAMKGENPESVRMLMVSFLSTALLNETSEQNIIRLLSLLDAFSIPYNYSDKMGPLILSLGRFMFSPQAG